MSIFCKIKLLKINFKKLFFLFSNNMPFYLRQEQVAILCHHIPTVVKNVDPQLVRVFTLLSYH